MHIVPHKRIVPSERNGPVAVRQWLWHTSVHAGGFEQSGPYLSGLWRDALARVRGVPEAPLVLVVGLGGGSCLREIEAKYPNARTTVIEWDPVMVDIAKELKIYKKEPAILVGDLYELLPSLKSGWDLVLIDAFNSDNPEPRLASPEVGQALARLVDNKGSVIVNVSRTLGIIDALRSSLTLKETWRFRDNTVALFAGK